MNEINNCKKDDIVNIIKASITYEKSNMVKKNYDGLEIENLSLREINNIIKINILCGKYENKVNIIREIIENKLDIKFDGTDKMLADTSGAPSASTGYSFVDTSGAPSASTGYSFVDQSLSLKSVKDKNLNRYIIDDWYSNYFYFSFFPLFLSLIQKIILNSIHYYMMYYLKFNYKICENNSLGILYNNNNKNKKTILFIHGFGFGYFPYINSLLRLHKDYNLIIIILPNISSFLYSKDYLFDNNKIKNSILNFIKKNKYKKIITLSHSFGTIISNILIKDKKFNMINKNILIDPVYFFTSYYKIKKHAEFPCYNKNNFILYLIDNFINYLIYDSIYLKHICYRYLCGPKDWDFYDNKNYNKSVFIFHKYDYVIDAESIYNKLKDNSESYLIETDYATHGTVLFNKDMHSQLIEIIEK
jgi:hypothetical protein